MWLDDIMIKNTTILNWQFRQIISQHPLHTFFDANPRVCSAKVLPTTVHGEDGVKLDGTATDRELMTKLLEKILDREFTCMLFSGSLFPNTDAEVDIIDLRPNIENAPRQPWCIAADRPNDGTRRCAN